MRGRADGALAASPWRRSAIAAVAAVVIAESLAAAVVAVRQGFGAGDLLPFLLWLVPFGVLTFMTASLLARLARSLAAPLLRALVALGVGAAVGYGWTLAMFAMMGPWFGTFSFPVALVLTAAGALAHLLPIAPARPVAR